MAEGIVIRGVVAKSTFDHIKQRYGGLVWQDCLARLEQRDRTLITAGGDVPLGVMGRLNEAFVAEVCKGSIVMARQEFRSMGAASADALLTGGGIFSIFARFIVPKQVLARAERVIKSAYPGVRVEVRLDADESGGVIRMHGMSGYPYGSQRVVGWLLRGIEIVGGRDADVYETNFDAGRIDSDDYEIKLHWEGWR